MILESALLNVVSGKEAEFESAFKQARAIISASPGFISLQLQRCLEEESHYLLLVRWQTLTDHVEGFRRSEGYKTWKALLHHFYEPFPKVLHFEQVTLDD